MTSFTFADKMLLLRAQKYLKRYQPNLVTISGGYQNLLTARAINLVLKDSHKTRPARNNYARPTDFAAAVLGTSTPKTNLDALKQLIGSAIRETAEDPEPEVIIPIINALYPGHIDRLAHRFPPSLAVLTSTSSAHLDYFSDPARRAHEQASLALAAQNHNGHTILNLDDPHVASPRHHLKENPITISLEHPATVHCTRLQRISPSQPTGFIGEVSVQNYLYEFHFPHLVAPLQITSALAALATALYFDINIKAALHDLKSLRPPSGYLSATAGINHATIIDSRHENPPEYLQATLRTIEKLNAPRKIIITTDIPGLSRFAPAWHQKIGQQLTFADLLITIGEGSKSLQATALKSERAPGLDAHHFQTAHQAAKWLSGFIQPRDLIFLAGHPSSNLSSLLQRLQK